MEKKVSFFFGNRRKEGHHLTYITGRAICFFVKSRVSLVCYLRCFSYVFSIFVSPTKYLKIVLLEKLEMEEFIFCTVLYIEVKKKNVTPSIPLNS
jgi:hypothetical protein